MMRSPAVRVERAVGRVLGDRRVRFTSGRRLVVRALARAAGPVAVPALHEALRAAVPLSSLYRTLTVLEEAAVVTREHAADGAARYELAEWLTGHHHHLVCADCGEVRDVAVDPEAERTIAGLVERVAAGAGYRARGHRIDIQGTCRECRTA